MIYNFSTIDGLFRPNYKVYNPVTESFVELDTAVKPTIVTYKPLDMQRVKSFMAEPPEPEETPTDTESREETLSESKTALRNSYSGTNYDYFRLELDKFIKENPEYESIKDSLQNLAALESSYRMDVTNGAGSGALGWFLFMDGTRKLYNSQTRELFANDPLALLLAAAQHYTDLQYEIARRGGDPDDFETMYGAWWRPESAYAYLKNPDYDFKTKYGESFKLIRQRARNLINANGLSYS